MYLWDTDAAAENVPYTVDGDGGTWIAVGGKYRNGDVYVSGDINYGGDLGDHTIASHSDTSVTGAELTTVEGRVDQDLKVAAAPTFAGLTKVGGASDYTAIDGDGDVSFHGTARIDWAKIAANSATIVVGDDDESANVSKLQTANDGNEYIVGEDNGGTPGINLEVVFTGVTAFNWVKVLGYYVGNTSHGIQIQIEAGAFDDSTWHTFNGMDHHSGSNDFESYDFFVPDDAQYINSGEVTVRFYHPSAGTPAHDLFLDEVSLYQ
jgi:hypothetical protein